MAAGEVVKIWPPEEDLNVEIRKNIPCPVEGCDKVLPTGGSLTLHQAKVHGIKKNYKYKGNTGVIYHYHCPVPGCVYYPDTEKHFKSLKLLKEHFGRVHTGKKFLCRQCGRGFGFDRDRHRHEGSCGLIYKCGTCQCPYTTKEALLMHCTRKQHEVPAELLRSKSTNKIANKAKSPSHTSGPGPCFVVFRSMDTSPTLKPLSLPSSSPLRQLLPKPVFDTVVPMTKVTVAANKISVQRLELPAKQTTEIQTDIYGVENLCLQTDTSPVEKTSHQMLDMDKQVAMASISTQVSFGYHQTPFHQNAAETLSTGMQTSLSILPNRKKDCSMAGTQTTGDLILKSAMASANIPIQENNENIQKSPRSKSQGQKRQILKTSEVQTNETIPPNKKKKRIKPCGRDSVHTVNGNTDLNIPSGSLQEEQLFYDYVSSISTQTYHSFLEELGNYRHETQQLQNSHTQTSMSTLSKGARDLCLAEEDPTMLEDLGLSPSKNIKLEGRIRSIYSRLSSPPQIRQRSIAKSHFSQALPSRMSHQAQQTQQTSNKEQHITVISNHRSPVSTMQQLPSTSPSNVFHLHQQRSKKKCPLSAYSGSQIKTNNMTTQTFVDNMTASFSNNLPSVPNKRTKTNASSVSTVLPSESPANFLQFFNGTQGEDMNSSSPRICVLNSITAPKSIQSETDNDQIISTISTPSSASLNVSPSPSDVLCLPEKSLLTKCREIRVNAITTLTSLPKHQETEGPFHNFSHPSNGMSSNIHCETGILNSVLVNSSVQTSSTELDFLVSCGNQTPANSGTDIHTQTYAVSNLFTEESGVQTVTSGEPDLFTAESGVQTIASAEPNLLAAEVGVQTMTSAEPHMFTAESGVQTMTSTEPDMFTAESGVQTVTSAEPNMFTAESGVQTMTSASELDLLVHNPIVMLPQGSGTDMHTQTADDLLDFLMMNMETQTTDDIFLGLSDIETQTPAESDNTVDKLVTTETQTNMETLMDDDSDMTLFTDMETQTSFNVVDFSVTDLTDSHTQTTFDDLTCLLKL